MLTQYLVRKLALFVPTLLLVSAIIFGLIRAIPGDPALLMVGDLQSPEVVEQVRREMGLDRPLIVQYGLWLRDLLTGDWGVSLRTDEPVLELLLRRFQVTAVVVVCAVSAAAVIGGALGVYAAFRQGRWADRLISALAISIVSTPAFWIGLILLYVFAISLGWLPVIGYAPQAEATGIAPFVLPIATLILTESAAVARITRATTLEVMTADYVTYARAKGFGERTVMFKHVLKNAAAPTLTLIGLLLGNLLGGAAVIETVFTLLGLGSALVEAIYARDYPVIQGALVFITCAYLLVNLAVDLIYPLLDPRVKL